MAKKKKKEKKQKPHQHISAEETPLTKTCIYLIWAGLLLALLVPIMVSLNTFFPFISYRSFWFMGCVQFTFAVWLFLAYHNPAYRPNLNLVSAAMILFFIAITLSTIFGADPAMSFWSKHERMTGLLLHLHLGAYFVVLFTFLKTANQWKIMLSSCIGIAAIVSLWGIADIYKIGFIIELFDLFSIISERLTGISQGGSTLGNASFMASYLLITAFFALYLLIKATGRLRLVYGLVLLLILLGIFLNPQGNAVKGSLIIGLFILVLLYLAFSHRHRLVRLAGQAALALGLLAAPVIGLLTFVEGSFVRSFIMRQSGLPGRIANWESGLKALQEKPLFGWGLENFEIALYQHYDPRVMLPGEYGYRAESWHDRAHNIVIDTLTATGVFGTITFFALIAIAVVVLWYYYFKEESKDFWAPGIFTALLAAHFIQNLTVFDMLSSYMLIFMVLAFAATRAAPLLKKAPREKDSQPAALLSNKQVPFETNSYAIIAILAVFVFFSFNHSVYKPYQGGHYTNRAMQTNQETSLTELYPLAIETSPLGRQHIRRHLAEAAANRLSGAEAEVMVEIHFPEVEYMISEMEKATEASPVNFRFYHGLGQILNVYTMQLLSLSSDEEMREEAEQTALQAVEVYQEALELSPTHITAYMGLAQALIYKGTVTGEAELFEESLELLLEAIEIEPRLFTTHQMAIRVASGLLRDPELTIELAQEAVAVNASWEEDLADYLE